MIPGCQVLTVRIQAELVVRNVYTESLEGELVEALGPVWAQLRQELAAFADFLGGVSQADDVFD